MTNSLTNTEIEARIDDLLSRMSLAEKIGQLDQITDPSPELIGEGGVGSWILASSATAGNDANGGLSVAELNRRQQQALNEGPHGIPMIYGRDVIHGHRTVFPIPIGMAASWDADLVERAFAMTAAEAAAEGVHWTFTPMLDIGRDARWGRVAEGFGEDPWLCARLAESAVRGLQGSDYAAPDRLAACAKHFVGYGACDGGRDYDSADIPPRSLIDIYLPSFKAAIDAGCATVMAAFNEVDGVPCHANYDLMETTLRADWGFDGFVVSDWNGVAELMAHGVAGDRADAAVQGLTAGVDMNMVDGCYREQLAAAVAAGRVDEAAVDQAVRRILRVKFRCGLFDQPLTDPKRAAGLLLCDDHRAAAYQAALGSLILLRNRDDLLPLMSGGQGGERGVSGEIGLYGPLAHARRELLGTWCLDGRAEDVTTVAEALTAAVPDGVRVRTSPATSGDLDALLARYADMNVVVLGEHNLRSGEANSVADIGLPPGQLELLRAVHAQGRPVVAVVLGGRAMALQNLLPYCDALLFGFHPGTEGGRAIADVLLGKAAPMGRLPVSLPRHTGQCPIFYNRHPTGRPHDPVQSSRYADMADSPLFAFGYGLDYTSYQLSGLSLASEQVGLGDSIALQVTVANTGARAGEAVVQAYSRDEVASVARPVQELKAWLRVALDPGESRRVQLTIPVAELAYCQRDFTFAAEPGWFRLRVGLHSGHGDEVRVEVVG